MLPGPAVRSGTTRRLPVMIAPPEKRVLLLLADGLGVLDSGQQAPGFETYLPNLNELFVRNPAIPLSPGHGAGPGIPRHEADGLFRYFTMGTGCSGTSAQARIREAIDEDRLGTNALLQDQFSHVRQHQSAWHLIGLVSTSRRHSEFGHLVALLQAAKAAGVSRVYVHCFLDGLNAPAQQGARLIEELEDLLHAEQLGTLASVIGRQYAMDTTNRWAGIEKAYRLLVYGEGTCTTNPVRAIQKNYNAGRSDWDMLPLVCCRDHNAPGTIRNQDGLCFFHTRTDGIYRLMSTFSLHHFAGFERKRLRVRIATLAGWPQTAEIPTAFEQPTAQHWLGSRVANAGKRQIHLAGMAHYHRLGTVFQGGHPEPAWGDDRVFIPDGDAGEPAGDGTGWLRHIFEAAREAIRDHNYALVTAYLAVEDLPGFRDNPERFHESLRSLDDAVNRLVRSMLDQQGSVVLTAGTGHAQFFNGAYPKRPAREGEQAEGTTPFLICMPGQRVQLRERGTFSDVAPTILDLLGFSPPESMAGQSLLVSGERS